MFTWKKSRSQTPKPERVLQRGRAPPKSGHGGASPGGSRSPRVSVFPWGVFLNFPAEISSIKHLLPCGSPEIHPPPGERAGSGDPATGGWRNTNQGRPGCWQERSPSLFPGENAPSIHPSPPVTAPCAPPGTGMRWDGMRCRGGDGGPENGRGPCASPPGTPSAAGLPVPPSPAASAGRKSAPDLWGGGGSALRAQALQSISPGPLLPLPCPARSVRSVPLPRPGKQRAGQTS